MFGAIGATVRNNLVKNIKHFILLGSNFLIFMRKFSKAISNFFIYIFGTVNFFLDTQINIYRRTRGTRENLRFGDKATGLAPLADLLGAALWRAGV